MLSPLEYLLLHINMIFLVDSYVQGNYMQKAAGLMQAQDKLIILQMMTDLQLIIFVLFALKLCLVVSRNINLEIADDFDNYDDPIRNQPPINDDPKKPNVCSGAALNASFATKG